jgi:hypothetical protein
LSKINNLTIFYQFTDLKGKNEDLSTKVSQFDEQKNTIINDTKNSLLNIGDGMQLNVESFSAEDEVDNAFIAKMNRLRLLSLLYPLSTLLGFVVALG